MTKCIYSFWEPKDKLPGYIKLCIKTWEKFLPDYKIIICDYNNLNQYLDEYTIKKILCKKMTLVMQSDAIRAALLCKHGGIWIDTDTIITSPNFFNEIKKAKCCMIGRKKENVMYGAFIYTQQPYTIFMEKWYNAVVDKVKIYRFYRQFKWIFRKKHKQTKNWDYCLNSIIDPLSTQISEPDFLCIDQDEINALPEFLSPMQQEGLSRLEVYEQFYFQKGKANKVLDDNKGIILLHNSWTPQKYQQMSKEEFLNQDILLSNILNNLLEDK
ncbi:MAG: capsular polysaccharide synthesis protein [Alphaproteobacteria bacterium]